MSSSLESNNKNIKPAWLKIIAIRDFRLLLIGSFFADIAYWMNITVLSWLAFEKTSSKTFLALIPLMSILPFMLLAPLIGTLIDRMNKRKLLLICETLLIITNLLAAWSISINNLPNYFLLIIACIIGFLCTIESSARMSSAGLLVPKEQISAALPMNLLAYQGARFISPLLAGFILYYYHPASCFVISSVANASFAICVLKIADNLRSYITTKQHYFEDLKEGIQFIKSSKELCSLFAISFVVFFFGYHIVDMMPALVKEVLYGNSIELGIANAAGGIGGILALILLMATSDYPIKRIILAYALTLVSILLISITFTDTPLFFNAVVTIAALCFSTWGIGVRTISQLLTPKHLRTRVLTVDMWIGIGVGTASAPVFGWAAENTSLQFSFIIAGAVLLSAAIWMWMNQKKLRAIDYFQKEEQTIQETVATVNG